MGSSFILAPELCAEVSYICSRVDLAVCGGGEEGDVGVLQINSIQIRTTLDLYMVNNMF